MKYEVYISTDKALLDLNFIHGFISNSYWGKGRTIEETKVTINNSLCFGVYTKSNTQIGFARVVTDSIFFGYFMDVIIDDAFQGKSIGKELVKHMLHHELIKPLKTIALKTKDAHSFYERYEFKKIGDSKLWMSIDKQKLEQEK